MISYKPVAVTAGFAYLWTLMLVAFMGTGLTLASHMYQMSVQREKEAELLFIGRQFRTALARYYASGPANAKDQYPATLEDLLKDPRYPNTVRHLRRLYRDPMTGKAEWGAVMLQGRVVGVHSLSEQKPIKQDNFEASDAQFRGKEKYSEWLFTFPPDLLLKDDGKAAQANPATPSPAPGVGGGMTGKPLDGTAPAVPAPGNSKEGAGK